MFLREVVLGAVHDGSLRCEGGLWCQMEPLRPSDRLVELLEARLAGLSPEQRALLELPAFGEPIGRRELQTVADPRHAEELERSGLLVGELSGRRLQLRPAHPLYADVLRTTTPATRAITVARLLAEAVDTVEHQLQSVYENLGISGRKDLAAALVAGDGSVSRPARARHR